MADEAATQDVLVVGGDAASTRLLSGALRVGYRGAFVDSRSAALDALASSVPSIIILVASHPIGDAVELARELRALDSLRHTGIILIADEYSVDVRVAAVQAGVDEFLSRPFRAAVLRALIQAVLALKHQADDDLRRRRTSRRVET